MRLKNNPLTRRKIEMESIINEFLEYGYKTRCAAWISVRGENLGRKHRVGPGEAPRTPENFENLQKIS